MKKRIQWGVILVALLIVAAAGCSKKPPAGEIVAPPERSAQTTPTPSRDASSSADSDASRDVRFAIEDVFFEYDKHNLTQAGRDALAKNADYLMKNPDAKFLIEGHCDERGTREYNLALGARRAAAVRDYLASLGVANTRMETVSYGKERPLDPRSNEEAWSVNRNGHTQIVSGAVS